MSATDIQALLRFLSQDAKVPLATAISKVKPLQQANLSTIESIAKVKIDEVQKIFEDEKLSKQVLNAAKRGWRRWHALFTQEEAKRGQHVFAPEGADAR